MPVFFDFDKAGLWWLYAFDSVGLHKTCKVALVSPESFLNWLGGDVCASTRASQIGFEEVGEARSINARLRRQAAE
jgi:hypothetical protein